MKRKTRIAVHRVYKEVEGQWEALEAIRNAILVFLRKRENRKIVMHNKILAFYHGLMA